MPLGSAAAGRVVSLSMRRLSSWARWKRYDARLAKAEARFYVPAPVPMFLGLAGLAFLVAVALMALTVP